MKGARKTKLMLLVTLAICQSASANGCYQPPVGAQFDPAVIMSVMNQPRPVALAAGDPELPRVYLDTAYVPPSGKTITVPAGGNLQAALNQAQPGDVISLQAGATFTGNFVLPNKTGAGWIFVRTSTPDANLPPPGTRITPASASLMPKIVSPNSEPALLTAIAAHHFRFLGIEFGVTAGTYIYNIVAFDADQTSMSQMPHDLILDRCYVHGNAADTARRGVALNCASAAVVDSYIADIHEAGADSQAIAGWNGTGPFKIVNNYLEGAGENILFGGAPPSIQNLVPSDIEFRLNQVTKPLSWNQGDPVYAGRPWTIKNLFELKNGQRLLVDRNTFENNWADAQNGFAILFTPRSEAGDAPWATVQDVTFTNNIVRHSGNGFNIAGADDVSPSLPSNRILIKNNLIDDINGEKWGNSSGPADGRFVQFIGGPVNITIDHNTIFQNGSLIVADVATSPGLIFHNNIAPHNLYGVMGSGRSPGFDSLDFYFPGYSFKRNVVVMAPSENYPADNFYPNSFDKVGFVDSAGGNYRLAASSPYRDAGTDGKNIGCDFDALTGNIFSVVNISAANYRGATLAVESIVAAFGSGLATGTQSAFSMPLPTVLAGTMVRVRDGAGAERLSPLFFVSPTQVNYQIPAGTATGPATITITSGNGNFSLGTTQISTVAPGVFTADSSGHGLPSANLLRVKVSGAQQFEPVARFDAAQNKWVAVPIDLGPASDQVYLVLYGTGIRFRSSLPAVTATIGGVNAQVLSADGLSIFAGLDQVNLQVPRTLVGRGDVDVVLTVDGQPANTVRVNVR